MLNEATPIAHLLRDGATGAHSATSSRGGPLIDRMRSGSLLALMEVHSGLSARIAENAGFEALWASGLAISSLMGLRDSNEASWSQVLTIVEWITDATDRPVLVDGDTGHGNFNNARRYALKLARCGAAGICLEDKLFPKTNSFRGSHQPLADQTEFCGKISAVKEATDAYPFALVARTEALVSQRSIAEALDRAHAYREAGADAILVHSKKSSGAEVMEFARRWKSDCPIIVVPTTYPEVDLSELQAAGVSAVIWANHSMRASAFAIAKLCNTLKTSGSPISTSHLLTSLPELFELLDYDELDAAEQRFLPVINR